MQNSAGIAAAEGAYKAAKAEVEARLKWEKALPQSMNRTYISPSLHLLITFALSAFSSMLRYVFTVDWGWLT